MAFLILQKPTDPAQDDPVVGVPFFFSSTLPKKTDQGPLHGCTAGVVVTDCLGAQPGRMNEQQFA